MNKEIEHGLILRLRNKEVINKFISSEKLFVKFQLNKKEKRICWQRFVSKDRRNWIKHNDYLSLKDVVHICEQISLKTYKSANTILII